MKKLLILLILAAFLLACTGCHRGQKQVLGAWIDEDAGSDWDIAGGVKNSMARQGYFLCTKCQYTEKGSRIVCPNCGAY